MDSITLLRSLQSDFTKRLTIGCLLHCEIEGQYSELTIISGDRLKALREFCWVMAEKYKRTSAVRDVFLNNLKGKLGEEVVKERLANLITEVDYEKRFGGDGKIDFTLTSNPAIGIEVKSRHGTIDRVRWSVSAEEVEKNAVVVCILIQEAVNEAQPQYHLYLAGFLPTQMIKLKTGHISFGINQLLYGGGLRSYLEYVNTSLDNSPKSSTSQNINKPSPSPSPSPSSLSFHYIENNNSDLIYIKSGNECLQNREYLAAISQYNQALQLNSRNPKIYYQRGLAYSQLENYAGAITDYTQAININLNYVKAYEQRGLAHYQLGEYTAAVADYTEAIRINPHVASIYKNRAEAREQIGDRQGAIEDYSQAVKIDPHYAIADQECGFADENLEAETELIEPDNALAYKNRGDAYLDLEEYEKAIADYNRAINLNIHDADVYYNRGQVLLEIGDKQLAIMDFYQAADIYWKEGKLVEHKNTRDKISELEIEASLDILNF